jgi:hypothetical protein
MTDEPLERDPELASALADAAGDGEANADWAGLRRGIHARAASELARRRHSRFRLRVFIPASLAAGLALFVLVAHAPHQATVVPSAQTAIAGTTSIDELLDANLSDGQFRALVSGAGDANDLLSIAAGESQ